MLRPVLLALLTLSAAVAAEDPLVAWWRTCDAVIERGGAGAAAVPAPPPAAGGVPRLHLRLLRLWAAGGADHAATAGLLARSQEVMLDLVQGLDAGATASAVPGAGPPVLLAAALPPGRPELAEYAASIIGTGAASEDLRHLAASGLVDLIDEQRKRAVLWAAQPERARELFHTDRRDTLLSESERSEVYGLAVVMSPTRPELEPGCIHHRKRLLLRYALATDCPPALAALGETLSLSRNRSEAQEDLRRLDLAAAAARHQAMPVVLPLLEQWGAERALGRGLGWNHVIAAPVAAARLLHEDPGATAGLQAFRAHAADFLAWLPPGLPPSADPGDGQRIFGYSSLLIDLRQAVVLAPVLAAWAQANHGRGRPLETWSAAVASLARANLIARVRVVEPARPDDPDPRPWMAGIGHPLCDLLEVQRRFAALPVNDPARTGLAAERTAKIAELRDAYGELFADLEHKADIAVLAGMPTPIAIPPLHLGLGLPAVTPPSGWSDDQAVADAALRADAGTRAAAVAAERLVAVRLRGSGPQELRSQWLRLQRRAELLATLAAGAGRADLPAVRSDLERGGAVVAVAQVDAAAAPEASFAAAVDRYLVAVTRPSVGWLRPAPRLTPALADEVFAARTSELGVHWAELALWLREGTDAAERERRRAAIRLLTAITPTPEQARMLAAFNSMALAAGHPVAAAFARCAGDPANAAFLSALDAWWATQEQPR